MEIILKNKKRVGSFPVNKNISFADGYRTVAPKLKYHKKYFKQKNLRKIKNNNIIKPHQNRFKIKGCEEAVLWYNK